MKNQTIKLKESVIVGNMLLEKGDMIKILTESYDWDDIVSIVNNENFSKETKGIVNFINKNRDTYKDEIKDFIAWFNEGSDYPDWNETMDKLIKKNVPSETGFSLPNEKWDYYRTFA